MEAAPGKPAFPSETEERFPVVPARRQRTLQRSLREFTLAIAGILGSALAPRWAESAEFLPSAFMSNATGSLVIAGGGELPSEVHDRFLDLAGGEKSRIVIIPTASEDADKSEQSISSYWGGEQRAAMFSLIHTRNRDIANDVAFTRPLEEATGVWISGGVQSRLEEAYVGTRMEAKLREVLDRGGVIGGTSAGAAVMSDTMIRHGNLSADLGKGLGFLGKEWVVDQHFTRRKRMDRLWDAIKPDPQRRGLGIDERTAVVIKGGTMEVIGRANVRILIPPFGDGQGDVQVLKPGDKIDLRRSELAVVPSASR